MNRILVLVVIALVPVVIWTDKENTQVFKDEDVEKLSLELKLDEMVTSDEESLEIKNEERAQVLVSNNKDKSDSFYLDLEEYVIGVVAGEMPASFQEEALKAQAIAARTYAMYKMENLNNYVLSTTINDQVYFTIDEMRARWGNDFDFYYQKIKKAVNDTKGEVLTYNGELIISYYFAISNGYTDDASVVFNEDRSYLVSVESSWDKNYSIYESTYTLSKMSFCEKLGITCGDIVISNVVRGNNNYVREITINGKSFTGGEVFNKLNLKSTDFNILVNGESVSITTYGFGHGVGLSQYGAQGMANAGYSYEDILKHYYKNIELKNI